MKKLSKKILSTLTAIAMIFTVLATPVGEIFGFVGETVKASADSSYTIGSTTLTAVTWYTERVTDQTIAKEAINNIDKQSNVATTVQSGKTVKDLVNFVAFESPYRVYGGKAIPSKYTNANGVNHSNFAEETTYGKNASWNSSRGCYWHAGYMQVIAYGRGATANYFSNDGDATASSLKTFFEENAQACEHIRFNRASSWEHSISFVSCNDNGFYYIDWGGSANTTPRFSYTTYEHLATKLSKYGITAFIYDINLEKNNYTLDLTSAPNNLGSQFVAPIKATTTGKVLTAGSDGNVTVQTWTGADNQRWIFTKNSSDNYYEIRNGQYVLKVLDVADAGNKDDANIRIWEDNDTSAQRFGIYGSQGSYVIKPKYSTTHVVDGGGGNNNVHLWQYYSPTIDNQKFTIEADPNPTFSDVKVTSVTNNNAKISAIAHKKPSTTTLKFQITVWPKDTGLIGSVTALMNLQSFTFNTGSPNVGKTSNEITFDLKDEPTISAGSRMTLNPDTEYNYFITSYYNEGGVTVSYSSSTYTFKTTNTCTHTFGSWVTKTSATCTADGLKQRTCSKCGKVESATITKLGHSYTSSVTKAATCTATGVKTFKCSRCTSSYTESIAATGHSFGNHHEQVHPHKIYKKCTVCSTIEYTGGMQYLYNCASCTNLTVPTITSVTSPANINKEVVIKWTASTSDKLGHYWVRILDPNGNVAVSKNVDKTVTSYTFIPTLTGEYTINIAATPIGSPDGTGSLWANKTITVHDIATYYEATHPHKYVNYCKNCDYMVYTGANLGYYEKCKTCHDNVAPSKPVVKNVASSYIIGNDVTIKWDATTNTTHYNLTVYKKNSNGEYEKLEWIPYVESGYTLTGYGVGEYRIYLDSYNSGYFYQYSESWRDWVHTQGDVVYFTIKPETVKSFSVSAKTANSVTLGWTANTTATGYIIQQMKNGVWTNIVNISNNATTSYTVSGLAASTGYSFRAVAYKTVNGSNIYGSYTTSTPAITLPASITDFAITGRDGSSLTLSWAKNTSADGYVIQQQIDGVWSNIAVLKSNATVTYKVTGFAPNTFYRFRMVAFKSHDGTKLYSKYTGAMSGYTAPAMVSGLTAVTDNETQLTVSWNKVDSANGYVLDIYKDGKWTEVARYKSNATLKYVATGLTAGTQYKFRVKSYAVNNSLTIYSTYSSPVIAVTKPAQVTGLKITANGSNSVSLSWDKVNASGYVIQCLKNNEWVTVGNIKDSATTSYTVTGLTANSSYKFRMVAYATANNSSVYGKYTAALAGRTAPAKVANLKMTNRGTDFISVRWDKDEKADGYMVYIYDGSAWKLVKTMTSNSAVSHKITGLASGTSYKVTVKAYKTVDNVKYISDSVTISATTL